eukprot:6032721-Pleurochrysis_carterae.AAC.1
MLARLADVVPSTPRRREAPTTVLLVRGVRTARTGGLGEIKVSCISLRDAAPANTYSSLYDRCSFDPTSAT